MEIADKSGVYKDFSGEIKWVTNPKTKWKETVCKVRNADFEILEREVNRNEIIFADVVFVSGEVRCCVIKNGLNLGCDFSLCYIDYMINKGGEICDCAWHDGIFEGGIFRQSIWYDGIWISGVWDKGENSLGKRMKSTPDKWKK